ncbi:hypothetical protein Q5752_001106 [Cryptotrichosporon argae]
MLHPPPAPSHPLSSSLTARPRPASPSLAPIATAALAESSTAGYFDLRRPDDILGVSARRTSRGCRALVGELDGTAAAKPVGWKRYLDLKRDELAVLDDALGLEGASDAALQAFLERAGAAPSPSGATHDPGSPSRAAVAIDEQRTPLARRTGLCLALPDRADGQALTDWDASQPGSLFPPSPPAELSPGAPPHPLRILARAVRELGETVLRLEEENARLSRRRNRSVDQQSIHNDLSEALSTSLTSPDGLQVPRRPSPTATATATSMTQSLPVSRPKSPALSSISLPFPASPDPAHSHNRAGGARSVRERASSRGSASIKEAVGDGEADKQKAGWGFWWRKPVRKASGAASERSAPSRVDEGDGDGDGDDEHAWRRGDGGSAPSFRAIYYATRIITPDPASILVSTTPPDSLIASLAHRLVSAARDAGIVARDPVELRRERSRSRAASLSASVRRDDAIPVPKPSRGDTRGGAPAWAGAADTVSATVNMGRSLLSSVSTATIRAARAPPAQPHDDRPGLLSRSSSSRHFGANSNERDDEDDDEVPAPSVEMASILPDETRPPTVLLNRHNLGSFFQSNRAKIVTATRFKAAEPPLTDRYGFIYDIQHASMLKDANAAGVPAPASLTGQAPEPEGWIERRRRRRGSEAAPSDSVPVLDAEAGEGSSDAVSVKSGKSLGAAASTVPSPRRLNSSSSNLFDATRSTPDAESDARTRDTVPRKRGSTLLTLNPSPARPTAAKDTVTVSARGASSLQPGISTPAAARANRSMTTTTTMTTTTMTPSPISASPALAHPASPAAPAAPSASRLTVSSLLDQLTDMHDRQQAARTAEWDTFLRRRPVRAYAGGLGLVGFAQMARPKAGGGADEYRVFLKLVRRGVPIKYRPDVWAECSGAKDARVPGEYDEILAVHRDDACAVQRDIEKDVGRTFPANVFFGGDGPGVAKLRRVLTAYAWYNPAVGYCQGMNMLAATLLLTHEDEEQAFYVLACVIGRLLPPDFFAPSLLGSRADQAVLAELVAEHVPKVARALAALGVDLASVTFGWFLSLFTDCLPVETLFRVWDVLFVEGHDTIFRVALAVLKMNEPELCAASSVSDLFALTARMTARLWAADRLIAVQHAFKATVRHADIQAKFERHLAELQGE